MCVSYSSIIYTTKKLCLCIHTYYLFLNSDLLHLGLLKTQYTVLAKNNLKHAHEWQMLKFIGHTSWGCSRQNKGQQPKTSHLPRVTGQTQSRVQVRSATGIQCQVRRTFKRRWPCHSYRTWWASCKQNVFHLQSPFQSHLLKKDVMISKSESDFFQNSKLIGKRSSTFPQICYQHSYRLSGPCHRSKK